ncbi:DcaP family trimeric outer membrane transporter [Acinetobacter tandoii]|uniref:DcaP family trimeric outer membrane transporter n=1 Tax=Acinetobacter tandoii TaxID=202954 RepID=UPI003016CCA6
MSLSLMKKPAIRQSLAVTIATLMMTVTHAASAEQEEIAQLRVDVEVLKALIQQNFLQVKQSRAVSPTIKPQTTTSIAVHSTISTEKASPLQVKTAGGSEVKLYGFVRGDVSYQFDGGDAIFNRINAVALSDITNTNKTEDRFYSTATTTRLGLDFKAPIEDQDIGGKVEVDFRGSNDSLRIRHAYLTLNNWLLGQTTSTFLATDLQPEMLDFNAPLGIGTFRTPMVRYSDKFNADTSFFFGLEKGRDDNRFPALTAKVKHNFSADKGTTSLRALAQEFRATDAENKTALSWGLGLGASYKFSEQLRVMGDYSHVKGDDKFLLYTNTAYNISPATTDINLNEFDALTVGATYQFNPKVRSTLGYGLMLANDNNDFADNLTSTDTVQNKTLQQGWLNVMFSPVTPVTLGVEYVYGERETFFGKKGKDNRVGAMARYNF